jgi:hypothetical protein
MERGMKPRREAKLGKCETRWRGGIIWSGGYRHSGWTQSPLAAKARLAPSNA